MKFLALSLALIISSSLFASDVYVNGYTRSNGTYVSPHFRSAPDNTPDNNYSERGNQNPYTGSYGTKDTIHHNSNSNGFGSSNNGFGDDN